MSFLRTIFEKIYLLFVYVIILLIAIPIHIGYSIKELIFGRKEE